MLSAIGPRAPYRAISAVCMDQVWKVSPSAASPSESLLGALGWSATSCCGRGRVLWGAGEGWERLYLGVQWLESYSSSEVEV